MSENLRRRALFSANQTCDRESEDHLLWRALTQCAKTSKLSNLATHRTTVNISITPELDAFLQRRVNSGRYQTTSEVVREGLRLLERHEKERDEAFSQLKARLERGAAQADRGELIDVDEVFEELRQMIEERRHAKSGTR
jgi:antitoxin ParD1/3/4